MIAVGNGEKCPFCDIIVDKDTDVVKHLTQKHPNEFLAEMDKHYGEDIF